ncbi:hypothetical protein F5876DRAFT_68562 [Lentinula aff. lateritia]|uniref:Uncharacterized protein n=1 Tax=Lentinula aff. lateritia TaxID=2804960 RepID=A0ACC1TQT3_9AGAR|nr:hypothetical protein F5876DRAFT_68562 [Lentinula aff. lateritia]
MKGWNEANFFLSSPEFACISNQQAYSSWAVFLTGFPPFYTKRRCMFLHPERCIDVVQASITNPKNSKLTGADIQLHGRKEFVCALKADQSGFEGPSNRLVTAIFLVPITFLNLTFLVKQCVLTADEQKFNELEKIESVEGQTSLTTVVVHPGDKIWISAETLARADLFAIKCVSSDEGNKICDAKLEISTEKWNVVEQMPLLADLTHYTPPPRNYTFF